MKRLSFHGAAGTVTGSCFLLDDGRETKVLIDCGMFQGPQSMFERNYQPFAFDPSELSAVVLTHAHLDHCGRMPLLIRQGYRGPIYMTEPTRALLELALFDAVKVSELDEDVMQMYTDSDVAAVLSQTKLIEYGEFFSIGPFHIIARDAGHILGSSSLEVHDSLADESAKTIIFSGDIGNFPEPLVSPTQFIDRGDVVVIESTYGDRTHATDDPVTVLTEETQAVERNGGTLLIPAFSIERSQEILHIYDHLKRKGVVKSETRVFLDSPMAIRATAIYRKFKKYYGKELSEHAKSDDPFHFPGLHLAETGFESRKIKKIREPKVIIAGSGMMTGGRILHHAVDYLALKTTRLLFVGFQGEETLGRLILEGAGTVQIGEHTVHINAHIRKSSGMSSHADQPRLLTWLSHVKGVSDVFFVHGEDGPRRKLAELAQERYPIQHVHFPQQDESFALEK